MDSQPNRQPPTVPISVVDSQGIRAEGGGTRELREQQRAPLRAGPEQGHPDRAAGYPLPMRRVSSIRSEDSPSAPQAFPLRREQGPPPASQAYIPREHPPPLPPSVRRASSSDSPARRSPPLPTSVLEHQRSSGGLHFKYDMPALAAAAAAASSTDALVQQLRDDGARLARQFARAQTEGRRLLGELGRAQDEGQRLSMELVAKTAQTTQSGVYVQQSREARKRAEEQVRILVSDNKSLRKELEVAGRALELERARTVSAVSSVARLRAERDSLRAALTRTSQATSPSTSTTQVESADEHPMPSDHPVPMEGVIKTRGHPAPRPLSSSESPVLSPPPSPSVSICSSSVAFPPSPFTSPLPILPPLSSTSAVHRPSAASTVPRPSLVKRSTGPTSAGPGSRDAARPAPAPVPRPPVFRSSSSASSSRSAEASGSRRPPQQQPTLKRKRSADAEVTIVSGPRQSSSALPKDGEVIIVSRPPAAAPGAHRQRSTDAVAVVSGSPRRLPPLAHGQHTADAAGAGTVSRPRASPPAIPPREHPPREHASPRLLPPLEHAAADTSPPSPRLLPPTDPDPPPTAKSKNKLGISHLPLLYETRGNTMYCRSCRSAFPAGAQWAELVGHSQGAHAGACAELEALGPAQLVEQRHRLQYLGKR